MDSHAFHGHTSVDHWYRHRCRHNWCVPICIHARGVSAERRPALERAGHVTCRGKRPNLESTGNECTTLYYFVLKGHQCPSREKS